MNIYAKLTLLCLFLVVLSTSVLFYFTNRQFEKTLRAEILSTLQQRSEESIDGIGRFIYSRINDIRLASKHPYFIDSGVQSEEMISKLQELESLNDLYYSFSYFDNNRTRIADSKRLSIGKQHSGGGYWDKLEGRSDAVMDIATSESVGRVVMHYAAPVEDASNDKQGVIVGRILVDELYKIMGDFSLSNDSTRRLDVNLVDNTGTILYSNVKGSKALADKYPDFDLVKTVNSGNLDFHESTDKLYFISKQHGYLSYAGNDWTLILSITKDRAFSPLFEIRKQLVWVIIPVLLGSIILALIAANIFVRPIIQLSKAASEIGKGNLETKIEITSKDEIGTLGRELKHASEILIERLEEQKGLNQQLEDQKKEIEAQKAMTEESNKQVADSLTYAERIQKSMLPDIDTLKRVVQDAFVFYRPKDVVSGDFYWAERVRKGRSEYLIVVAADCTGHGVPGAIMSIMGSNQLTNIVYYQNYLEPEKILARLDKGIKLELYRDDPDARKRDGMEIGVCVINLDDLKMGFAGAGIPLYMIRNGELEIHKSPKYMIGGMDGTEKEVEEQLSTQEIQLKEGDRLYMSSDGYQDQFGGEDDKRFMAKNFRTLLIDNAKEPMNKVAQVVQERYDGWKGEASQTDDVLVLGIEI
ncbi:MAG: SpoIIE family protein phosphatase [Cyclobacteriaceae bacterium]|nr:SpoIIE family protein phosphatase [Cyclobacteriaceae bacterium HetDA_MAG_MS6]